MAFGIAQVLIDLEVLWYGAGSGDTEWQITSDAIKGGTFTAGTAVALGYASVKTTFLFGSIKVRHHLIKKEFREPV